MDFTSFSCHYPKPPCKPEEDQSVLIQVEVISSLEVSRHEGLIRLPNSVRDQLGIRYERQFVYDNDKCLGNRLKRLMMITSEDFNAYLLRTFAAMIESDKFDISAYNENYESTKSIKIFVFDSVNKRSYNYRLVLLKFKTLGQSIFFKGET